MDVSTVWRFILSATMLAVFGVAVFAYMTYSWVVSDDTPTLPIVGSRDTQTIAELKEVINEYQQKEKDYVFLLAVEPPAPATQRGIGASIPSSMVFEAEVATTTASTSPTDGTTPGIQPATPPRIID